MIKASTLTQADKDEMVILFCIRHNVQRATLKPNVKEILTAIFPDEDYSDEASTKFFARYMGKENIIVIDDRVKRRWTILEDNNIILTDECFVAATS